MKSLIDAATRMLKQSQKELHSAAGETIIWRRQSQRRRAVSDAFESRHGGEFLISEHVVQAVVQVDRRQQQIVYGQFAAQVGDTLVRLQGAPQGTAALSAPRAAYLTVASSDVRRDAGGEVIYGKFVCHIDISGRWSETHPSS